MRRSRVLGALMVMALVVGACGGDSSSDGDGSGAPAAPADGDSGATETTEAGAPSDDHDDAAPTTAAPPSGGAPLDLVPEGATDILGNPAGQGFVEIDGVRYDFVLDAACQNVFGAVQAAGNQAPDGEGDVDAIIPPEDWESDTSIDWDPPYVQVDLGDALWRAEVGATRFVGGESVELTPEQSSVTSFTNDGSLVAGTANFQNEYNAEEIETATGSFQFFCPDG